MINKHVRNVGTALACFTAIQKREKKDRKMHWLSLHMKPINILLHTEMGPKNNFQVALNMTFLVPAVRNWKLKIK